jgi:D-arabinose 1-dehydrogenase-like Zn-dependent alcohol dehydrogenase
MWALYFQVDTYIRAGLYAKLPALPYIPGKDAAGVVHSVGTNTKKFSVGDRVYIFGGVSGSYSQYSLCNAANVFHLPSTMTFEQGACLGTPAFTAYRALFEKAKSQPGETVFIHGASGAVGLAAIQLARAIGMRVVGTAGTNKGIQVCTTFELVRSYLFASYRCGYYACSFVVTLIHPFCPPTFHHILPLSFLLSAFFYLCLLMKLFLFLSLSHTPP